MLTASKRCQLALTTATRRSQFRQLTTTTKNLPSPIGSKFNSKSTAAEVMKGYDLSGQTIVVTGSSSGIGIPTAIALAQSNATVLCLVRDAAKMRAVIDEQLGHGQANARQRLCIHSVDLSDLESVAVCADGISREHSTVHGLICNAGVMFPTEYRTTHQGFEYHLGVNFLSHFALTHLLTPLMETATAEDFGQRRLVVTSAVAMRWGAIDFDDLQLRAKGAYSKKRAYGQSSMARCLFATEFDRRWAARQWHAYSLHPGIVVSGLQREFTLEDCVELHLKTPDGEMNPAMAPLLKSSAQGAATQLWALTEPRLDDCGGGFLQDCEVSPQWDGQPENLCGYSEDMFDPVQGKRLWQTALDLVTPYIS